MTVHRQLMLEQYDDASKQLEAAEEALQKAQVELLTAAKNFEYAEHMLLVAEDR